MVNKGGCKVGRKQKTRLHSKGGCLVGKKRVGMVLRRRPRKGVKKMGGKMKKDGTRDRRYK